MALVTLGTVALALYRDARVIAGLGYGLAFLTALLGTDALLTLTLAYVALLGTSLAWVVAAKRWLFEGLLGSLATGGLFLALAWRAQDVGDPDPSLVAGVSLLPAAAFLWLALRARAEDPDAPTLTALLTVGTFAWAAVTTLGLSNDAPPRGVLLLAWALASALHATLGSRTDAPTTAVQAASLSGIAFWLLGAPLAWSDATQAALLTILTYAAGATALALAARLTARRGIAIGALVLASAAALWAIGPLDLLRDPSEARDPLGPWQAWTVLAATLLPLALLTLTRTLDGRTRGAAILITTLFATFWTFALFGTPILTTLWLLLIAGTLAALALAAHEQRPAARAMLGGAILILLLAALKSATVDTHARGTRLDAIPATLHALVVAASLLALHHTTRARATLAPDEARAAAAALVGTSAAILANAAITYAEGGWPSILIGALGVTYLATGFTLGHEATYRYTGFGLLAFVLARVLLVDMQNTDLIIRALVFAILGTILLGIGYWYARLSRKDATP